MPARRPPGVIPLGSTPQPSVSVSLPPIPSAHTPSPSASFPSIVFAPTSTYSCSLAFQAQFHATRARSFVNPPVSPKSSLYKKSWRDKHDRFFSESSRFRPRSTQSSDEPRRKGKTGPAANQTRPRGSAGFAERPPRPMCPVPNRLAAASATGAPLSSKKINVVSFWLQFSITAPA